MPKDLRKCAAAYLEAGQISASPSVKRMLHHSIECDDVEKRVEDGYADI